MNRIELLLATLVLGIVPAIARAAPPPCPATLAGVECTGLVATTELDDAICGDANGDGDITAGDALIALRAAVGTVVCSLAACDYNGDENIAASDALSILRRAVGQSVPANCPLIPTTPLTWDEGTWGQVLWN